MKFAQVAAGLALSAIAVLFMPIVAALIAFDRYMKRMHS